ncbi:MAG TPA: cupredoxin family copper-binding protein [Propylenella sp.]|nr:cupredoxin family copper-binding protein [Propylenella sp.]
MATTHQVSIENMTYNPNSLSVTAGDTVVWTNKMSMAHTATADDGSFDSGSIARNKTFSHTFNSAGAVPYHCDFHPDMMGRIDVRASG